MDEGRIGLTATIAAGKAVAVAIDDVLSRDEL